MPDPQDLHQIEYRHHQTRDLSPVATSMPSPESLRAWDSRIRVWVRHPHADRLSESVCYQLLPNGQAAMAWRYWDQRAVERADGTRGRPLVSRVLAGQASVLTPDIAVALCLTGLPDSVGPMPGEVPDGAQLPTVSGDALNAIARDKTPELDQDAVKQAGLQAVVAAALADPATPLAISIRDIVIQKPLRDGVQYPLLWGLRRIAGPLLGPVGRGWSFSTFEPPLGEMDPTSLPGIVFRQAQDGMQAPPIRWRKEVKVRPLAIDALDPGVPYADQVELAGWLIARYQERGGDGLKQFIVECCGSERSLQLRLERVHDQLRDTESPMIISRDSVRFVSLSAGSAAARQEPEPVEPDLEEPKRGVAAAEVGSPDVAGEPSQPETPEPDREDREPDVAAAGGVPEGVAAAEVGSPDVAGEPSQPETPEPDREDREPDVVAAGGVPEGVAAAEVGSPDVAGEPSQPETPEPDREDREPDVAAAGGVPEGVAAAEVGSPDVAGEPSQPETPEPDREDREPDVAAAGGVPEGVAAAEVGSPDVAGEPSQPETPEPDREDREPDVAAAGGVPEGVAAAEVGSPDVAGEPSQPETPEPDREDREPDVAAAGGVPEGVAAAEVGSPDVAGEPSQPETREPDPDFWEPDGEAWESDRVADGADEEGAWPQAESAILQDAAPGLAPSRGETVVSGYGEAAHPGYQEPRRDEFQSTVRADERARSLVSSKEGQTAPPLTVPDPTLQQTGTRSMAYPTERPPSPQQFATVSRLLKQLELVGGDTGQFDSILQTIFQAGRQADDPNDRAKSWEVISNNDWYDNIYKHCEIYMEDLAEIFGIVVIPDLVGPRAAEVIVRWAYDAPPPMVGGLLLAARKANPETWQAVMQILEPVLALRWVVDSSIQDQWDASRAIRSINQLGSGDNKRGVFSLFRRH